MNLHKYLDDLSQLKFTKNTRIVLLALYAVLMFVTISTKINTLIFIILFVIVPVSIYFLVKIIFPKQ